MAEPGAGNGPVFPSTSSAFAEDLLIGRHLLRQAFLDVPLGATDRDTVIISADDREPPALLIHRGVAYSAYAFPDGRRTIIDLMLPTDIVGLEHAVLGWSDHDVIAASPLFYRPIPAQTFRQLAADSRIAAGMLALMAKTRRRMNRHVVAVARMDALGRTASFLMDIYDRLRRANLIARPTFDLHLSQNQIADHLGMTTVHVNRIFRRLREERLAIVHRGVMMILDVERLRAAADGLPGAPQTRKAGDPEEAVARGLSGESPGEKRP